VPVATDITLWTDISPKLNVTSLHPGPGSRSGPTYAALLGWPFTLLGLAGALRFRKRLTGYSTLYLTAVLLLMLAGSSAVFSGCAGPGAVVPVLTPAGSYPVTVTVSGDGITQSTTVYFVVGSPGIPGQE
jgi:hypothetical protein